MKRRDFLINGTVLAGFSPLANLLPPHLFLSKPFYNPDVAKVKIGDMQCTFLRDTMFKYQAKDYFINAKPEEVNQLLQVYNATPDNIPSPFIAVLVQYGKRKILIDTGIGFQEEPLVFRGNTYVFKGKLDQLLKSENINQTDITDVVITHFHPDHIGGIFKEGQLKFTNAKFHMHEQEWEYWHSAQSNNQPALFKYFIENNISKLGSLNLNLVKGDFVELLPGITSVKAEGHTPGQIALILHSKKDHLLYISDAFLHPLHIEKLDWQTNYDLDHERAKQTRIKLLDMAYKEDMLVNAFHFDFPGLGHIEKKGLQWAWKYSEKQ